jgi:hypothetical protein
VEGYTKHSRQRIGTDRAVARYGSMEKMARSWHSKTHLARNGNGCFLISFVKHYLQPGEITMGLQKYPEAFFH